MITSKNLTLDVAAFGNPRRVYAKQHDHLSRTITAKIMRNGVPTQIDAGVRAYMRFHKPDGEKAIVECEIDRHEDTVSATLTDQVLDVPGIIIADVVFVGNDGSTLSTECMHIVTEQAPVAN